MPTGHLTRRCCRTGGSGNVANLDARRVVNMGAGAVRRAAAAKEKGVVMIGTIVHVAMCFSPQLGLASIAKQI